MKPPAYARAAVVVSLVLLASTSALAQPTAQQPVIGYLNEVLRWYHEQVSVAQLATDPSDVVFADAVRRQAGQVVKLAIQFARADVSLEPTTPAKGAGEAGQQAVSTGNDALKARAQEAASTVVEKQAAVDAIGKELGGSARSRSLVGQRLAEARSELQLALARRDALSALVEFSDQSGVGGGSAGLLGQIDELERSVPEAAGTAEVPAPAPSSAASQRAGSGGVVALVTQGFSLARKLQQLRDDETITVSLRASTDKMRAPLGAEMRETLQQANQASSEPQADDPKALADRTQTFAQLTQRFKAVAGALVPLAKLTVLIDAHRAIVSQWHTVAEARWAAVLRTLLLHLGLLAVAIAAILVASGFWRRATLRYVHDPRRRQQSLLIRRIVVGATVALMVIFSLVTEVGSLATFAGFITAGLAVALQNVILSVAAYFFLIGRYGIRVGDRVEISGISGDVMDIGLVRLHLMELGSQGLPTGRVVVFSNAVLFQPNANFFKQIPGSNYSWHQLVLTLSPESDVGYAEKRIMDAVGEVYARYHDGILRQHQKMAQNLSLSVHEPGPQSQLRLTQGGLEMTIRFPVPLENASEVDDEVARALLSAVDREPRLKLVGSATPTIQGGPQAAHAS